MVEKQVQEEQRLLQERVLGNLMERYIKEICDRNKQLVEVSQQREKLEVQKGDGVDERELHKMEEEMEQIVKVYDKQVQ